MLPLPTNNLPFSKKEPLFKSHMSMYSITQEKWQFLQQQFIPAFCHSQIHRFLSAQTKQTQLKKQKPQRSHPHQIQSQNATKTQQHSQLFRRCIGSLIECMYVITQKYQMQGYHRQTDLTIRVSFMISPQTQSMILDALVLREKIN